MDNQSQYLAQALRAMQEQPGQPQQNPQAMGLGRMRPGMGQAQGAQPQDPNAPRPTIGDNLQQAWQNVQGAPGRFMDSFQNAGQNLQNAPGRVQNSIMGLGQLFKG